MLSTENQKEKNAIPDKREYQLQREAMKTILIVFFSMLLFLCLFIFFVQFNDDLVKFYNDQKSEQLVKDTIVIKKPVIKKPVVNNTGLDIVIKVSKDYRKYFVSYKSYYTPSKYYTCIDQITFDQFMTIQEGDTIHKSK